MFDLTMENGKWNSLRTHFSTLGTLTSLSRALLVERERERERALRLGTLNIIDRRNVRLCTAMRCMKELGV
jgi:hypothetical protein